MGQNIEFVSTVEGLDQIEECRPKPSKNYIPEWFKNIPNKIYGPLGEIKGLGDKTVKRCPSFPDFFSQGYVLPMWTDTVLSANKDSFNYNISSDKFKWETHPNNQLLDYVDGYFNGVKAQYVFKAICPWKIITPPGWSVLQLPLFYHFNQKWSVLPGVVDTDIHNDINQQVLYHTYDEQIFIERGQPFALYIPFKRKENLGLNVRYQTKEDEYMFTSRLLNYHTLFKPTGLYRKLQRLRDKDE